MELHNGVHAGNQGHPCELRPLTKLLHVDPCDHSQTVNGLLHYLVTYLRNLLQWWEVRLYGKLVLYLPPSMSELSAVGLSPSCLVC